MSGKATDNYMDPPNAQEIAGQFMDLTKDGDIAEIEKVIYNTFPTWLQMWAPRYSDDYPHLQKNWEIICDRVGVKPLKIVIVDAIVFDDKHRLVLIFSEAMTKRGYVVRRKGELVCCPKCGSAIPSHEMYQAMKGRVPVPEVWRNHCSKKCM